jgi:hypothetical protein
MKLEEKTRIPGASPKAVSRLLEGPTGNGKRKAVSETIEIHPVNEEIVSVRVISKTPLICHAWSAKAIRQILGIQTHTPSPGREKRNPLEDFRGTLYPLANRKGFGIPAPAFKGAIVNAANSVQMKMTVVKGAVHVDAYLVPIIAPKLAEEHYTDWDREYEKELEFEHSFGVSMRLDMVRNDNGGADIRFRGCFPVWEAVLQIEYNRCVVSAAQVVNLLNAAGWSSGIGDNRPSSPFVRTGENGRFKVKQG